MAAKEEGKRYVARHGLIAAVGIVAFACTMACASEAFPSFVSGEVVHGANLTWRNYVAWWNETQGTPLGGPVKIDASLWDDAIARLEPEYVYTHGVNIVIVRSCRDGNEEGFYVALSIASSPGPNDEQFTRMAIAPHAGGTVYTFRRQGHFEQTQQPEDDSMARLADYVMEVEKRGDFDRLERMSVLRDFLARQKELDRELLERQDLPEEVLAETPTDKLFRHYLDHSYRVMMSIASTPSAYAVGVQRLLNSSSTIHELHMRPDMAEGILRAYRDYDLSPESMSDEEMVEIFAVRDEPPMEQLLTPDRIEKLKIAHLSMTLSGGDTLLLSPQFFPKLKGHEKEFLAMLLERYDKITGLPVEDAEDAYGAAMGSMHQFCFRLAKGLDSELYGKLSAINSASPGQLGPIMEAIRHYLNP